MKFVNFKTNNNCSIDRRSKERYKKIYNKKDIDKLFDCDNNKITKYNSCGNLYEFIKVKGLDC